MSPRLWNDLFCVEWDVKLYTLMGNVDVLEMRTAKFLQVLSTTKNTVGDFIVRLNLSFKLNFYTKTQLKT